MKRIEYLDNAKAILIMLMVLGHVYLYGSLRAFIYVFHMPAFLIITGMLYARTKSLEIPLAEFISKRIKALIIPFFFFEGIGVITDVICNGVTLNLKGYLYNTLTQNWNNGPDGFLVHLFLAVMLFYFIHRITPIKIKQFSVCLFVMGLALIIPSTGMVNLLRMGCVYCGFLAIGFFVFSKIQWNFIIGIMFFVLTCYISRLGIYVEDTYQSILNLLVYIIGAIAGTYCVLFISKMISSRLFSYLGRNTIVILGTHNMILLPFRRYCFPVTDGIAGIIAFIAIMLCEFPIIYFINRFFPIFIGREVCTIK